MHDATLGFAGEASADATFLRRDGTVWTTDKDGIVAALLAAEITACAGRDPSALYYDLANEFGNPFIERVDASANAPQKRKLAALPREQIDATELAGQPIGHVMDHALATVRPLGGQGRHAEWLVRRAPFRFRGHLQNIRREF